MKNNVVKRLLAGSLALAVGGAGLTGAYGYDRYGLGEVQAADKDAKESADKKADKDAKESADKKADKDIEKLEKTAEGALESDKDSDRKKSGDTFKEESVYIKADPSGNVTETTVTEWLKNPGNGDVEDESELSDIKNVKGEESFSKGSGSDLKWKSEGEDIYYQGTAGGKLPVGVEISYRLDGKKVTAEELKGKSGKVEINIRYTNHSGKNVKIGGKKVKMYTPFTMVTAMMLSTDEYKNVEVDNGRVLSDGDKDIVVGLGFPGLQDNLDLDGTDLDVEIPDSVKITAEVTEATVSPTVTVASAELMNEFGFDDIDSFDDLEESLDELKDAAKKLKDGSKDAADGAKKLADGSKDLKDGTKKLKSGSGELADGSRQVADGVSTLNAKSGDLIKGVNSLVDGVNTYTSGVGSLADGSKQVAGGAKQVSDGAAALNKKAPELGGSIKQLNEAAAGVNSAIAALTKQLASAENAVNKADADVEYTGDTAGKVVATRSASEIAGSTVGSISVSVDLSGIPEEYREEVRSAIQKAEDEANERLRGQAEKIAEKALDSTEVEITKERTAKAVVNTDKAENAIDNTQSSIEQLKATAAALAGGMEQLNGKVNGEGGLTDSIGAISQGAATVSEGADTLAKGAEELNSKSSLLTTGTKELKKGGAQLASGVKELDKGAGAVADGAKELDKGVGQLDDGAGTLHKGSNDLADGSKKLADGMSEFKRDGVNKLTDVFDGDFKNVKDRLNAMSDLSKEYKSFAGIKKGMNGKTKFIIETEGIDED